MRCEEEQEEVGDRERGEDRKSRRKSEIEKEEKVGRAGGSRR